jgi:hypothetical protein
MKKRAPKKKVKKDATLVSALDDWYSALRTIGRRSKQRRKAVVGGHAPACWPMRSAALSVHPKQIKQATERARALGVPTDFHPSGDPIFTSKGHRAAYMKNVERGVFDRDGGYGDAQCGPSRSGRTDAPPFIDFSEAL